MKTLHGVDFFVGEATRSALCRAVSLLTPAIPHLFFNDEAFDDYVGMLGVENLAVARELDPEGDVVWKLDLELVEPIPSEQFAMALSRSSLLVAQPSDEVAQYSSYLVYQDGRLAYEALLEDVGERYRLTRLRSSGER